MLSESRGNDGIFWGWYIVAGSFLLMAISYGTRYCFGIFVQPLSAENGWSRSVVSLAASVNLLFYAAGGIYSGRLLDRIAPRWIATIGAVVGAAGFILSAYTKTAIELYITYGVLCGLGAASTGNVVGNSSVGKWFVVNRGLAIGIASAGVSLGTVALTPLAGLLVKRFSWQVGFMFFGFLLLVPGVLISQLFFRKTTPEAHGCYPDGKKSAEYEATGPAVGKSAPAAVRVGDVLRDGRFWKLAFCQGMAVMTAMMLLVYQVPYALDNGIGKIAAAASLGVLGFAGFIGQLFFGWLSDRIPDPKYSAIIGYVCMMVGMIVLLNAQSAQMLFIYALIFGFGYGCLGPVLPIIASDRFGRQSLGVIYGLLNFFVVGVAGSLGPVLGGLIYDRLGSYRYAWILNINVLIAMALFMATLSRNAPEKGRRLRTE